MQIVARRFDTAETVAVEIVGERVVGVEQWTNSASPAENPPWIAPAFLDLQVNGYGGQEFSVVDLTIDKIAAIVRRLDGFGVARFCPTVTTNSFDALAHALRTLAAACASRPDIDRRVLGIHLEGPYISPLDGPRGAHPVEHCRPPDWNEFQRLQEAAAGRIRLVTLSAEYRDAQAFIARLAAANIVAAIGHTAATGDQIRAAVDAGARLSTHLGNGAHRELRRHPNYLWDQLAEDRLWASLIVDGHHLPPEVVQTFIRAKTPQRCLLVSDLSGWAGCPVGRHATTLGDLEILDDGRLVVAGQRQLLAGASAPIGVGVANLLDFAGLDLHAAVDLATVRPAQLLGIEPPRLEVGAMADLVLFDLHRAAEPPHRHTLLVRGMVLGGEPAPAVEFPQ